MKISLILDSITLEQNERLIEYMNSDINKHPDRAGYFVTVIPLTYKDDDEKEVESIKCMISESTPEDSKGAMEGRKIAFEGLAALLAKISEIELCH